VEREKYRKWLSTSLPIPSNVATDSTKTGNRHKPREITECTSQFLVREIELIRPIVIAAVGREAERILKDLKQRIERKEVESTLREFPETFYISSYARGHWKKWEQQFPDLTQRVEELLRESGR
jgi:uracil-DNA glycosylase